MHLLRAATPAGGERDREPEERESPHARSATSAFRTLGGNHRQLGAVLGMVDPDRERSPLLECLRHRLRKLEAQEMHRGGLLVVLALEVLVGHGVDALGTLDPDPDPVLDALEARKHALAFRRVGVLDHHRRLEVPPVGNERVVSLELGPDAVLLEDPLDAQHLLDLVADRQFVLEGKRQVAAELDLAIPLVRDHARAEVVALPGVGLQREQAAALDLRAAGHCRSDSP